MNSIEATQAKDITSEISTHAVVTYRFQALQFEKSAWWADVA